MKLEMQKIVKKQSNVKKACVNCQRIHKKCDNKRPCGNCLKKKIDCFDVENKYRKRVKPPPHYNLNKTPKINITTEINFPVMPNHPPFQINAVDSKLENEREIFSQKINQYPKYNLEQTNNEGEMINHPSRNSLEIKNTLKRKEQVFNLPDFQRENYSDIFNKHDDGDINPQDLNSYLESMRTDLRQKQCNKSNVAEKIKKRVEKGSSGSSKNSDQTKINKNKIREEMNKKILKMKNKNLNLRREIEKITEQDSSGITKNQQSQQSFQNLRNFFKNKGVPLNYLSHFSFKKEACFSLLALEKNLTDETAYNPSNTKFVEVSDSWALAYGCEPQKMLNKTTYSFSPYFTQEELVEFSKDLLKCCKEKFNHLKLVSFIKHQTGLVVCVETSCSILCDDNLKPQFIFCFFNKSYVVEDQMQEKYHTLFMS
eukprot:TRINITY_DN3417_c0_g1_i1.p1 TRINITY_DN3417_c0_g1~~TRINITY_DN3417_c0_g1_i1.p1  ORF type:complete len:434 (-),score=94.11 TRINITY_DN3417_c0_g1_i1:904-2184(-)